MQKWNIPTDRAWGVDEKIGVIFLVIMFTPGVMVIKMSKNGSFFVFFANDSKILVTVQAKHLSTPKGSFWVLSENGIVNWFWSYRSWVFEGRNIKKLKLNETLSSRVDILLMVAQNPTIHSIFWKSWSFRCT